MACSPISPGLNSDEVSDDSADAVDDSFDASYNSNHEESDGAGLRDCDDGDYSGGTSLSGSSGAYSSCDDDSDINDDIH
jgi:hypothetical protein